MKRISISLNDLFNLESSVIYNPDAYKSTTAVCIDSRQIKKNCLYVAIAGEKHDGHDFVDEAIIKGAAAVLINEKKLKRFTHISMPIITVKNTLAAYGQLANIWRNKLNAVVIGITGSNGKTTTKEMLAAILSQRYQVVKSAANNNNHIGVPLSIFSANASCEVLVLEHGTNHFGEIAYTAKISDPDFALITNIGESHIEFLLNKNGVYKEKSELFKQTLLNRGKIFVNADDPVLNRKTENIEEKITFAINNKADYKGTIKGYDVLGRTRLEVKSKKKNFHIESTLPVYGYAGALNALPAIAIAHWFGLAKNEITRGIESIKQVKGRQYVDVMKNFVLIDDTYNANPISMRSAFDLLRKIKLHEKKILILGDMFELGSHSNYQHNKLAVDLIKIKPYKVFLTGKAMKSLFNAVKGRIDVVYFSNRDRLKKTLQTFNISRSVVLVKGSRGMKMEEFSNELKLRN